MKNLILAFIIMSITAAAQAQPLPAYILYSKSGEITDFGQLSAAAAEADIVLFGELHDNPICHWLQLELTKALHTKHQQQLVLAAEMFETDDQLVLDEYLVGMIREDQMKAEAKLWNNYKTDYAPLVNYAKAHQLHFVASNIPRRYASMVARMGPDTLLSLPAAAQQLMAPLPLVADLSLPGYKNMLDMMKGHGGSGHGGGMAPENFAYAQAIKDATMAHRIGQQATQGKKVLHFHGTYHSNNFEGIYWYLKQQEPSWKIVTIASVTQQQIDSLSESNQGMADFIICIPESMTRTY